MKRLTIKLLEEMPHGIFAKGEIIDSPDGVNINNSGSMLRWVAVRGGIADWAIYCGSAINDWERIKTNGNKVFTEYNIRKLVPCFDEAFKKYRY